MGSVIADSCSRGPAPCTVEEAAWCTLLPPRLDVGLKPSVFACSGCDGRPPGPAPERPRRSITHLSIQQYSQKGGFTEDCPGRPGGRHETRDWKCHDRPSNQSGADRP